MTERTDSRLGASDIPRGGWLARHTPSAWLPYVRLARLDRPIGTWLLLWPCWWSLALAAERWPDPWLLALFGLGAMAMRGAGCVWNDITDREFDGRVARTRDRPIPGGEVSVRQALMFMAALSLVGLAILVSFNAFAVLVGLASAVTVAIYPFMKRFTWWPQFFLGLAFNWGALLGWAAVRGELGWPALLLYAGGICWTLGYDTIYAHQDAADDALLGLKSSALRLGRRWTRPALILFYGAATILFAAAGLAAGLHPLFLAGLLAGVAQLAWQVARLDIDDAARCLVIFRSNRWFGWLLFAGILAG